MGSRRYLNQRMYDVLSSGEHLHFEVATLIPQHPYSSRNKKKCNWLVYFLRAVCTN